MQSGRPWLPKKWHSGDVYALAFLLSGLMIILYVAYTGGEHMVWTLWIALPMLMFSLAYLFLVSALPIFLGPRSDGDSQTEEQKEDGHG